jgi:hypothetical protein
MVHKKTYNYHYACIECGYPFLSRSDANYCSNICSSKSEIVRKKKSIIQLSFGDNHSSKKSSVGIKIKHNHANVSGKYNPNYKGFYFTDNIPMYDTYAHQLEPYEQCRRNDDPNILEVKCTYCGKWYIPTRENVSYRLRVFVKELIGVDFIALIVVN